MGGFKNGADVLLRHRTWIGVRSVGGEPRGFVEHVRGQAEALEVRRNAGSASKLSESLRRISRAEGSSESDARLGNGFQIETQHMR